MKLFFEIIFITSMVCAITIFWELYEFALDYFFQFGAQFSLGDTMYDMFLSVVGGLFMACFAGKITFKKTA